MVPEYIRDAEVGLVEDLFIAKKPEIEIVFGIQGGKTMLLGGPAELSISIRAILAPTCS